jgi:ankyrin repeat protein
MAVHVHSTECFGDDDECCRNYDVVSRNILHYAIETRYALDIIQSIIAKGISLNEKRKNGETLLHAAVFCSPECYELLLKNGADVNGGYVRVNVLGIIYRCTPMITHVTMETLKFANSC